MFAGCDEAKEEVGEVVDFLREPKNSKTWAVKFQKVFWNGLGPPGYRSKLY